MGSARLGAAMPISYYTWLCLRHRCCLPSMRLASFASAEPEHRSMRCGYVRLGAAARSVPAHYFGFFALVTGGLLLRRNLGRACWHRGGTFVAAFAAMLLLISRLCAGGCRVSTHWAHPDTGTSPRCCLSCRGSAQRIRASCSRAGDGSAVLFHSDCSVIANNFILRPEDAATLTSSRGSCGSTPPRSGSNGRTSSTCSLRTEDFIEIKDDAFVLAASSPIAMQLLARSMPPPGFEILATIHWRLDDQGTKAVFARLFKIVPDNATPEG